MEPLIFFQVMGAVLAANALTLWFVYGAWTVTKIERSGGKPSEAPWSALMGLIVPCLALVLVGIMLKAWEDTPGPCF